MPGVDVSVIGNFLHPPLQFLSLSLVAGGPYAAGDYTLTRPLGPVPVNAFGILYSVVIEDLHVGIVYGLQTRYDERVVEIVVDHRMLSGELVVSQRLEGSLDSGMLLWSEASPEDVRVRVGIGFAVDFYWLVIV